MIVHQDRVERVIDAIAELENNQELARVIGEALQLVTKRGHGAWEELFVMLRSLDDQVKSEMSEWTDELVAALAEE